MLVLSVCLLAGTSGAHAYVLKTTKTGRRVHWSAPVITLSVDDKLKQHFGAQNVNAALTIATDAWRGLGHVPDVVISDRVAPGYQPDARTNGVYLMKPWPFAREQLAVTVSTYDLDGHMIGADVLVNGESDYALLEDGADEIGMTHHDLAAVLTHEVGHVLGLDESADDKSATMWPYIRGGDVHQRTLSTDDEDGVIAAYKDVVFETDSTPGCTQASVLGARPEAGSSQVAVWIASALFIAHRLTRRPGARPVTSIMRVRKTAVVQVASPQLTTAELLTMHVNSRPSQHPVDARACRS